MSNRDRVAAELPPAVRAWLTDASAELWDALARDVALRGGRALLDGQADFPEEDDWRRDALSASPSPAVRHAVTALPRDRRLTPHGVAHALCAYLELFGAADWLQRKLGSRPNSADRAASTP